MEPIRPMLMFSGEQHGRAHDAITLYLSVFPRSQLISINHYGSDSPLGPEGTVQLAHFELNGQPFMAMDSAEAHGFNFTPSVSFFVTVDDLDAFDSVINGLSEGGQMLMPRGNYGFSEQFAWFNDRFGVSWQLSYG